MNLGQFSDLSDASIRLALIVLATSVAAALLAIVLHRMGVMVLRRLSRNRPFVHHISYVAFRASQISLVLFAVQLVLTGASNDIPGVISLSYIVTVLLILALTWLVMRCIKSITETVSRIHSPDTGDNLRARRLLTHTRVLARSAYFITGLIGLAFVLLTFPGARQFGESLLASAGVAGLVAGIAARPVLGNFIAGLQIAFSQPIRIDDVLIVKGEWGRVEEITGTFVVIRIWDERRLIVPLQWFIENPFENWTHSSSTILGSVSLWVDFAVPVEPLRQEFERFVRSSPLWDQRVCNLKVTDSDARAMQIRLLISAPNSSVAFDMRCQIREAMIAFIATQYPEGLPRLRSGPNGLNGFDGFDGSPAVSGKSQDDVPAAKFTDL